MGTVKALLDTHAFLWWIGDDPSLSKSARKAIADEDNDIYLSAASVWEIAIKARIGRLNIYEGDVQRFIDRHVLENAFYHLPVTLIHSAKIYSLSNHHRDPFDQMLASQSLVERFPIITADKMIQSYGVEVIW